MKTKFCKDNKHFGNEVLNYKNNQQPLKKKYWSLNEVLVSQLEKEMERNAHIFRKQIPMKFKFKKKIKNYFIFMLQTLCFS